MYIAVTQLRVNIKGGLAVHFDKENHSISLGVLALGM
jgi:hypothetical protein